MSELLREALIRRKKRLRARAGLESEDLKEKRMVDIGEGVPDEVFDSGARRSHGSSTDELSPSRVEQKAAQVDDVDDEPEQAEAEIEATDKDMAVFDEREYRQIKKKKKPNGLLERVQLGIGDKYFK